MVNPSTSEAVILERAASLTNQAIFTVAQQRRRLRTAEPEDDVFAFRWWADLQFLILALRRLRRAAQLAARVPAVSGAMEAAIADFDRALPALTVMRNVGEHIDDYAVEQPGRHHKDVDRRQLQVGSWDGGNYCWLGHELNIDDALAAGGQLYVTVKNAAGRGS